MEPTSIDTTLTKSAMENALDILTSAGISNPGPTMKAYLDNLGLERAKTSYSAVIPPPFVYPPTPSIKHLGRPKVKS